MSSTRRRAYLRPRLCRGRSRRPRGQRASETYQRSQQRLYVLPTETVGQRVGDGRHLFLVEDVHVEVQPEASGLRLEPLGDEAPQPFG